MISRVTEALSKVKGSMGSHERHALPGVIGDDLLRFGKLPLCLFICIILTAVTVVTTAHHTRLLTAQREQLVLERDALDIEWRNLILEENAETKTSGRTCQLYQLAFCVVMRLYSPGAGFSARTRSVVTSYLPGFACKRGRHAFSSRSASFHLPRHDY